MALKLRPMPKLRYGLTLWDLKKPPTYDHIKIPEAYADRRLTLIPKTPNIIRIEKSMKKLRDIVGPETNPENTELHFKQFAIVALFGGQLKFAHFEILRIELNKWLDLNKCFLKWRIPPPYKPITKKPQGTRMGGGKGAVSHYVTPVKRFRVLVEVGGHVEWCDVQRTLTNAAKKMPCKAAAVTYEEFEKMKEMDARHGERHIEGNPFCIKDIIDKNMLGLRSRYFGRYNTDWYLKYN